MLLKQSTYKGLKLKISEADTGSLILSNTPKQKV